MATKAKAKVVASFRGAAFIQFLANLATLHRSIWKNRMDSIVSSKSTEAKQLARNWTKSAPQTDVTTFAFASLSILLLYLLHMDQVQQKNQLNFFGPGQARPCSCYICHHQRQIIQVDLINKKFHFIDEKILHLSTPWTHHSAKHYKINKFAFEGSPQILVWHRIGTV